MSLLQQIKMDQIAARKNKDKTKGATLTTLYSEAANVGLNDGKRETTDQEVISIIKKFIKNVDEVIKHASSSQVAVFQEEKELYQSYLPQQLKDSELLEAVKNIVSTISEPGLKHMGDIMKQLNTKYTGQIDGKSASNIVRTVLQTHEKQRK